MDWVTVSMSILGGAGAGFVTFLIQERKLRQQYKLETSAEKLARELLEVDDWPLRSFPIIKHHLGGFDDDELRKILVRAGAIRFHSSSGKELWGLLKRNRKHLRTTKLKIEPEVVTDESLYEEEKL